MSCIGRSSAESPIYGLNGPVRPPLPVVPRGPSSIRPTRAPVVAPSALFNAAAQTSAAGEKESATAKLVKAIEAISEESLQLPDPNPNASKSGLYSDVSSPRSGGSPFSLGRFPLPPALPSGKSESDMPTMREQRDSGSGPDIDAEFELVAPRRPDARLQSFPSTTRGSDVGFSLSISPDAGPSDALQVDRYQYQGREITSFIGGGVIGAERKSTSTFLTLAIFFLLEQFIDHSSSPGDIEDARAISRILGGPSSIAESPRQTRLPIGVVKDDPKKQSRVLAGGNSSTTKPAPEIQSLPANPRPVRSTPSPDASPVVANNRLSRIAPSRPRLQQQLDLPQQFERPRPAPAP